MGQSKHSMERAMDGQLTGWTPAKREVHGFFCPNCRTERRVPGKPTPYRPIHIARIALLSAAFTLACFPILEWKGLVSFLPFWVGFEVLYRLRFRSNMGCPHCGFDPYLYMSDMKRARQEVDTYWRRVFKDKGVPFPGDEPLEPVLSEKVEAEVAGDESAPEMTQ